MIGIYKITNLTNGMCYIGQSKDLDKRRYQHWHSNFTPLDSAILANPNNFTFEILEECPIEKLTERETYYISKYDSVTEGYNCASGGCTRYGAHNSNAKLDIIDVLCIRGAYANHRSKHETYEMFKNKIDWRGFEKVWSGVTWKQVRPEVFSEENKAYYKSKAKSIPQKDRVNIFTDEEIMQYRNRYVNETINDIYKSLPVGKCTFGALKSAITIGYKHLPIYRKEDKTWIYP